MRKRYLTVLISLFVILANAQTVSTFMQTSSNGCYGLALNEDYVYVVSSFNGTVHRKAFTSTDSSYETFEIGGSGYQGICKVGDYVYVSKPYNGSAGLYRFNPAQPNFIVENFMDLNHVFGLASRNAELYLSASDKIYKVDLNTALPSLLQIADNINGTSGFFNSTMGIKVYDDFLYVSDESGISKINLDSGNFEKELITAHTGSSFAKGSDGLFYVTNGNAVYEIDTQTQTSSLLVTIDNFIGTYDIVFANHALFVTTLEGDYDEVAKIDLSPLNVRHFDSNTLFIYPNPAEDHLHIGTANQYENLKIISPSGQVVKKVAIENGMVDISDLQAGIYFLKGNNTYSKFIKR